MTFIDEALIQVVAGDGGNGCIAFRREKFVPYGGPSGGDGGHGASVYLVGDRNLNTLHHLRYKQRLAAESGRHGEGSDCTGRSGKDLEIRVPLGTVVRLHPDITPPRDPYLDDAFYDSDEAEGDETDSEEIKSDDGNKRRSAPKAHSDLADLADDEVIGEVIDDGQRLLVANGGRGGRGNARYAKATRQSPRYAEDGSEGEMRWLRLELKLLADVGLVGLPNAGKSTLISTLSAAKPKIASYPFTTIVPQLGVVADKDASIDPFVIADLPGLIAGAASGAGLGHQFLRHIERCRVLVHLVDLSGGQLALDDPDSLPPAASELEALEAELEAFDSTLLKRQRLLVGSKVDAVLEERRASLRAAAEAREIPYLEVSAATHQGLTELKRAIRRSLKAADKIAAAEQEAEAQARAQRDRRFDRQPEEGVGEGEAS